jgi:hypothetical protein
VSSFRQQQTRSDAKPERGNRNAYFHLHVTSR